MTLAGVSQTPPKDATNKTTIIPLDDPEVSFSEAYSVQDVSIEQILKSIDKCQAEIAQIALTPFKDVIIDYEVFTKPDFLEKSFERDPVLFFNAVLAIAEYMSYLCVYLESKNKNCFSLSLSVKSYLKKSIVDDKAFLDLFGRMKEKWENTKHCPLLQEIMKAAFGLVAADLEIIKNCFTPSVIKFLTETVLVQSMLCQSRVFPMVLEVFGKVFVFLSLKAAPTIIRSFIDNEKKFANYNVPSNNQHPNTDFQTLLRLFAVFGNLWPTAEFSEYFICEENFLLRYNSEFISPSLFCALVELYSSIIRSTDSANKIIKIIDDTNSEIISFPNFLYAIRGHADDLNSCEIDRRKLSSDDAMGLESVIRLLSKIALYSSKQFFMLIHKLDPNWNIVTSLIFLVLSPIPASLKSKCFDLIGRVASKTEPSEQRSMCIFIWEQLKMSQLLTYEHLDAKKGGILDDIYKVEVPAKLFSLTRSFIRMLTFILDTNVSPDSFSLYHRFMCEEILQNLKSWSFSNTSDKWGLVCEISQCWTNLLNHSPLVCEPLYTSALCDHSFVQSLLSIITDEDVPLEALLCVFRLLYLLSIVEDKVIDSTILKSRPLFTPVATQISWNSNIIYKLMRCVACIDRDLQIVSIHLLKILALSSPNIVQVILTKPQASSISVIKHVLSQDEQEEDHETNVRCTLLSFLLSLGSSSFFLRHVCGFDQYDPPISISQSSLKTGILNAILSKLILAQTLVLYPLFSSLSFQILLLLCEHHLTIGPLLNLLLSTKEPFFSEQLRNLSNERSPMVAIGCFLQILAREASNNNEVSFAGVTLNAFRYLLSPNSEIAKVSRNILAFDFIDRIDDMNASVMVSRGIQEVSVAYLNNPYALTSMSESGGMWRSTWTLFILTIIEKVLVLQNRECVELLTEAAAVAGRIIFGCKSFGEPEISDSEVIYGATLQAITRLHSIGFHSSMISLYSLIDNVISSIPEKSSLPFSTIFSRFENSVISSLSQDSLNEVPALRGAAFSAAESLLPFSSIDSFSEFSRKCLLQIESDWRDFNEDPVSGGFILKAKCSYFIRYIALSTNNKRCRLFVDNGLVFLLSHETFWKSIAESYSTCATSDRSETFLIVGSKILRLLSTLIAALSLSEDIKKQIDLFLNKFRDSLCAIMDFGGLVTQTSLNFLSNLMTFISLAPGLDKRGGPLAQRVPNIFQHFVDEDSWKSLLRERSQISTKSENVKGVSSETQSQSVVIVSRILQSSVCFLAKLCEHSLVFSPPLFGEEWRTSNKGKIAQNKPPLSVITSFLNNILGEADLKKVSVIASMCLLIIWRHIDRWAHEEINFDIGLIKSEATAFKRQPFIGISPNTGIDTVILKKIIAFANDK